MKRIPNLLPACITLTVLAGCAPLTPELDKRFGESVRVINAQQTLSPEASTNTALAGMDGPVAHHVFVRYNKSYGAPAPQPNVFTIGMGTGGESK